MLLLKVFNVLFEDLSLSQSLLSHFGLVLFQQFDSHYIHIGQALMVRFLEDHSVAPQYPYLHKVLLRTVLELVYHVYIHFERDLKHFRLLIVYVSLLQLVQVNHIDLREKFRYVQSGLLYSQVAFVQLLVFQADYLLAILGYLEDPAFFITYKEHYVLDRDGVAILLELHFSERGNVS